MGKPTGFKEYPRELPERRPVNERIGDFEEIYRRFPKEKLRQQAARCTNGGVPTWHAGCPMGNLIPDWNDLVYRERWRDGRQGQSLVAWAVSEGREAARCVDTHLMGHSDLPSRGAGDLPRL
jgi:NADPH-dependent glutamate synthase beta subunit-like oxidoreductase